MYIISGCSTNYGDSMSKLLIIEGPDNVGKDLLISKLSSHFNNTVVLHAGIPTSTDLFEYYYNGIIHDTLGHYYEGKADLIIHNRSMYGEYVYGPKYRNEKKDDVADMIKRLEIGQLKSFFLTNDLYLLLLTSSSVDLLVRNDDGLSISNERQDIIDELKSFNDIFNSSSIKNKKIIYVNDGDVFKDPNVIFNEALDLIV